MVTITGFVPAAVRVEIVTVPAAGSVAVTIPPVPRACQSAMSRAFLAFTSSAFIATTIAAGKTFASAGTRAADQSTIADFQTRQRHGYG